jgi:hypothetical protein
MLRVGRLVLAIKSLLERINRNSFLLGIVDDRLNGKKQSYVRAVQPLAYIFQRQSKRFGDRWPKNKKKIHRSALSGFAETIGGDMMYVMNS